MQGMTIRNVRADGREHKGGRQGTRGRTAGNVWVDEVSDGHVKLDGHPSDPTLLRSERSDRLP